MPLIKQPKAKPSFLNQHQLVYQKKKKDNYCPEKI